MGFRDSALSDATRMNGEAMSYVTRHGVPLVVLFLWRGGDLREKSTFV